jgi:undecaprenyl diphosphate synthase
MDGNGRWADARGLPRIAGHRAGVKAVGSIVEHCARIGVKYLTLFAFSTENWRRPGDEVTALMGLLDHYLQKELVTLMENNVRLMTIGRTGDLPEEVNRTLAASVAASAENTGLTLILALSYSGRTDIIDAVRSCLDDAAAGKLDAEALTQEDINRRLATDGVPDPDLLVRTSGEMRLSNFLLWQAAYSEFYVTDKLWPDFRDKDLDVALEEYRNRERRFGMTSEQVAAEE